MWEFSWSHMDDAQRRVIEFGMDAGFGERNSMGFGFVNIRKEKGDG
jgi:CRISPR-associated endoribonuclease Cas6